MRTVLCFFMMIGFLALGWSAGAVTAPKRKPPARRTTTTARKKGVSAARRAPSKASTVPRKSGPSSKTTASRRGTTPPGRTAQWRTRQVAPTPERYKEIQDALVAKGYLPAENATGSWNQTSMDALKRFQAEQKIEATGKINSLSLIALGLGPKRETVASVPKPGSTQN